MNTRRSFLFMSAAIITTPGVLMPVRKIITPPPLEIIEFEIGRYEGFRFIESTPVCGVDDPLVTKIMREINELAMKVSR